jgi:hypothetical protein
MKAILTSERFRQKVWFRYISLLSDEHSNGASCGLCQMVMRPEDEAAPV